MASFLRLMTQKFNTPAATTEPFAGLTILLTGATTGLGLEAAKKIAALHADNLIITARDQTRGDRAKQQIEEYVAETQPTRGNKTVIHVLLLDMSSTASVQSFADRVNAQFPRLDAVILNAGTLQARSVKSPDGWEETLQVNVVSTVLLGLLLLPNLLAAARSGSGPTHLTFVSSGKAKITMPSAQVKQSPTPMHEVNEPNTFLGGQGQYSISKVFLEAAMQHISASPQLRSDTGDPLVVVNSTCPGMCYSELGRALDTNVFTHAVIWLLFSIVGRTAEQGSHIYLSAIRQGPAGQGKMWKDDHYFSPHGCFVDSQEGRGFGQKVWEELAETIQEVSPHALAVLG